MAAGLPGSRLSRPLDNATVNFTKCSGKLRLRQIKDFCLYHSSILQVTYRCDAGHIIWGTIDLVEMNITCLISGDWDLRPPTCVFSGPYVCVLQPYVLPWIWIDILREKSYHANSMSTLLEEHCSTRVTLCTYA